MKINSVLIKNERERRAWSQEHLAMVAGLGLRTVQRIETSGLASYESIKAIASVYEMTAADFRLDAEAASSSVHVPNNAVLAGTDQIETSKQIQNPPDKKSGEWKSRPAWVRAIFAGSSLVRMDRRQLKKLELGESIVGTILAIAGIFALFDLVIASTAAMPLLFSSVTLFAAAYLAAVNISIGDKFSVWPWLETVPRSNPRRLTVNVVSAFGAIFLLVLFFPDWV